MSKLDGAMATSLGFHLAMLAVAYTWLPPLGDDRDGYVSDQRIAMTIFIDGSEAEPEPMLTPATVEDMPGIGVRDGGAPRRLGTEASTQKRMRYGITGPPDNPDPHVARREAFRSAWSWPSVGVALESDSGALHEPTAPWGRDDSLGTDAVSGRGAMWGDLIGDARGASGLSGSGGVLKGHT